MPLPKQQKLTAKRVEEFLAELRKHGIATQAARAATPNSTHYQGGLSTFSQARARGMRDIVDGETDTLCAQLAQGWEEALDEARDVIRGEIYRRAVEGWEVPVFQGGRQVGSIRKYSDRLLEVRARAILPEHRKDGEEKTDLEGLELTEEEVKERAQRLIEHIRSIRSEPNELL